MTTDTEGMAGDYEAEAAGATLVGETLIPESPRVSVVVATHDRRDRLEALLDAMERQSLPTSDFEVIVIDDGSNDGTPEMLGERLEESKIGLRILRHASARGPASAREAGWRAAGSGLIAFTDDDCEPDPGWLAAGLTAFDGDEGDLVLQGRTEPIPRERSSLGPFSRTIEVQGLDPGYQTCNIFYLRATLERIGGFDTAAFDVSPGGEDADLAWRAIAAGASARFDPKVLVHHAVNELGPVGKLRVAARWTTPMYAFAKHPDQRRRQFILGVFWKRSHLYLALALSTLLLRGWFRVLWGPLAYRYLWQLYGRLRTEGGFPHLVPYLVLHDLVEMAAVLRAAIRYRAPMA